MNKAIKIVGGILIGILAILYIVLKSIDIIGWGVFWILQVLTVIIPIIIISIIWIYHQFKKDKKEEKLKAEASILPTKECETILLQKIINDYGEIINETPKIQQTVNAGETGITTPIFRLKIRGQMNNWIYDGLINQANPSQISILINATEPVVKQAINDMAVSPARENKVQTFKTINSETMQPEIRVEETKPRGIDVHGLMDEMKKIANAKKEDM